MVTVAELTLSRVAYHMVSTFHNIRMFEDRHAQQALEAALPVERRCSQILLATAECSKSSMPLLRMTRSGPNNNCCVLQFEHLSFQEVLASRFVITQFKGNGTKSGWARARTHL